MCGTPLRPWPLGPHDVLDRCPRCGHVQRDVRRCPASARARAWGGDADLDAVRLWLTYRRLRRYGAVRDVCEIGFGSGRLLRRFLDDGATVTGVDRGQLGIDVDPRLRRCGRLVDGDVETADLPGAAFDLVYAVHVVEHVTDPGTVLRRAYDLLRPGGLLYLLTPTADSAGPRVLGPAWWLLEDPTHVRFFSPQSARIALLAAGFTRVRVRRPVLDNVSMEVCSLVRAVRRRPRAEGVLSVPGVAALATATAPLVLAARLAAPSLRPTLEITAVRP
jgi:SAM-dependent methyltransferase